MRQQEERKISSRGRVARGAQPRLARLGRGGFFREARALRVKVFLLGVGLACCTSRNPEALALSFKCCIPLMAELSCNREYERLATPEHTETSLDQVALTCLVFLAKVNRLNHLTIRQVAYKEKDSEQVKPIDDLHAYRRHIGRILQPTEGAFFWPSRQSSASASLSARESGAGLEEEPSLAELFYGYSSRVKTCRSNFEGNLPASLWASIGRVLALEERKEVLRELDAEPELDLQEKRNRFCASVKAITRRTYLGCQFGNCGEGADVGYCLAHEFGYEHALRCFSKNDHAFTLYLDPQQKQLCMMERWDVLGRSSSRSDGTEWGGESELSSSRLAASARHVHCGVVLRQGRLLTPEPQASVRPWFEKLSCFDPVAPKLNIKVEENDPQEFNYERWRSFLLMQAARAGDVAEVQNRLKEGVQVNGQDPLAWSALHHAVKSGDAPITQLLLEHQADVNLKTQDGDTPLVLAVKNRKPALVHLLLAAGADVTLAGSDGFTPLMQAAFSGNASSFETLVAQKKVHLGEVDPQGRTLLMLAVRGGSEKIVNFLLARGFRVNVRDRSRATSLMLAAQAGQNHLLPLLIKRGARINDQTLQGEAALMFAAQAGNAPGVKKLLAQGALVNLRSREGATALSLAFAHAEFEIAKTLLQVPGVNPDWRPQAEPPLLMAALSHHRLDLLEQLLQAGASVSAQDAKGHTPLMQAALMGDLAACQLLLKQAGDVSGGGSKAAALMMAASQGHAAVVELLLAKKAAVGVSNQQGVTALFYAIEGKNLRVVEMLLAAGAQVNVRQFQGFTPLMFAAKLGDPEVVKLLLAKGASVELKNARGETAYQIASRLKRLSVFSLLQTQQ